MEPVEVNANGYAQVSEGECRLTLRLRSGQRILRPSDAASPQVVMQETCWPGHHVSIRTG